MPYISEFCQFEKDGFRCTTYRHDSQPELHQLSPKGSLTVQKIEAQEERERKSSVIRDLEEEEEAVPEDENWDPIAEPRESIIPPLEEEAEPSNPESAPAQA